MTPLEITIKALERIADNDSADHSQWKIAKTAIAAIAAQQQATPSATIDSDEFRELLKYYSDDWAAVAYGMNRTNDESCMTDLIAHIDARIAAAGMADKRDANRYRALREMHWSLKKLAVVRAEDLPLGRMCYSGDYLDEAIDAAMTQDQKGG